MQTTVKHLRYASMDDFIDDVLQGTAEFEELGDCEVLHSNELLRQHLTDPAVKELGKTLRSTRQNAFSKSTGFKEEKMQEECYVCGKMLVDIEGLKRHMLIHKNIRKYGCKACDKRFHTAGNRSKHYQRVHLKCKPFHCPFCKRDFFSKSHLDTHIATHTGEKRFKCNMCNAAFARNWVLTNHKYIHTGETPYKCDVCPYACRDNSSLRKHKRRHGLDPYYKCTYCGKRYAEKQHLKSHIAEHLGADTRIFHCEHCTKRFKVKQALVNHMKIKHFNIKRWRCKICTGAFWSEERLQMHHEERHIDEEKKVFICGETDCGRIFNSKAYLVRHGRKHGFGGARISGRCSICGRMFRSAARAKRHEENVHREGDRRRNCPRCGRIFFTDRHLIIHMKRHNNGGRFYYCHYCDWGYSSKQLLWIHIKTSHQFDMQGFPCQFPDCKKQFWHEGIVKKHMLSIHKTKYIRPVVRKIPKVEESTQIQVAELHIDAEGVEVKQELMDEFLEVLGIDDLEHFGDEGKRELFEEETDSKDFAVFTVPRPQIKKEVKIKSEKFQINTKKDVSELNDDEMSKIAKKLKCNLRKDRKKAEAIIRYHYTKRFRQVPKVPEYIFDHFIETRAIGETEREEIKGEIDFGTGNVKEEPVDSLFEDDCETEDSCETRVDEIPSANNESGEKQGEIECENEKAKSAKTVNLETTCENTETHNEVTHISKTTCEKEVFSINSTVNIENQLDTGKIACENDNINSETNNIDRYSEMIGRNKEIGSHKESNISVIEAAESKNKVDVIACKTETKCQGTNCLDESRKLITKTNKNDYACEEIRCETKTEREHHKIVSETVKIEETQCETVKNGCESSKNCTKTGGHLEKSNESVQIGKVCDETPQESQSGRPRRQRTLANYTDYRVMAGLTPTRKKYWNWNRANDFFVDDKSESKDKSKKKLKKNVPQTSVGSETDLDSENPLDKVLVGNVKQNYHKFYKTTVCVEQCYTCMQVFPNRDELDQHMFSEHSIVKYHSRMKKCPYCDYCTKFNIKRHIKAIHGITLLEKLKPITLVNVKKSNTQKSLGPSKKKLVCKNGVWHVVKENIGEIPEGMVESKDSKMSISDYLKKMSDLSKIATKTKKQTLYPCNKCSKICVAYCGLKVHMRLHDPHAKPFKPKIWKHKTVTNAAAANAIEFSDAEYFSVYPKYKKEVRDLTIFRSDLLRVANTKREIKKNGGRKSEFTNDDVSEIFKTKISSLARNFQNSKCETQNISKQDITENIESSIENVSDIIISKNIDKIQNSGHSIENISINVEKNMPSTILNKNIKTDPKRHHNLKNTPVNKIIENVSSKNHSSNSFFFEKPNISNNEQQKSSISSDIVMTSETNIRNATTPNKNVQNPEILFENNQIKNIPTSRNAKIAKQNKITNEIPQNTPNKVTKTSPNITFLKGTKTQKKNIVSKRTSHETNKNNNNKAKNACNSNELKCLLCSKLFENKRVLEKHLYEHICGNSLKN